LYADALNAVETAAVLKVMLTSSMPTCTPSTIKVWPVCKLCRVAVRLPCITLEQRDQILDLAE
jgi:hypothetical protein